MPVRKRIIWGGTNPFSDPRLHNFAELIRDFRAGKLPHRWRGNKVWKNKWGDLPTKPHGHYTEFYVGDSMQSGDLRVVLGKNGEIYISGDHHDTWRQILDVPILPPE